MPDASGNTQFAEEFLGTEKVRKIKDVQTLSRLVTGIAQREYIRHDEIRKITLKVIYSLCKRLTMTIRKEHIK